MNPATQLLIEKLKGLADSGVALDAAASEIGSTRAYLVSFAHRHGIKFNCPERPQPEPRAAKVRSIPARSHRIAELFKQGMTLEEIGAQYAVTRERIRQILWADHGLKGCDGGQAVTALLARATRLNKTEERYQRKYGCSKPQYREILRAGGTRGFTELRRNAARDGYKVELNLWQWWTLWQESGHWNERGRGRGYWLFRLDQNEPLSVNNFGIAPGDEAMSEMRRLNPSRFPGRPAAALVAA